MPKRILFIHHGKGIGGASLSLLYLVQSLNLQLFDPIVLFMQDSAAIGMFVEHGIKIVGPINKMDFSHTKIWWYRWYHPHHLWRACVDSWQLWRGLAKKYLREIDPAIVHLNTSSLWPWAAAAKQLNIPLIWHIREPLSDGYFGLRKALTRWAVARWSTKIVAICQDNASPWQDLTKTTVLYNAVPESKFLPSNLKDKKAGQVVLFLGGLSQEKGTLWLLQSFAKVQAQLPTAKLIIAGNWQPKPGFFGGRLRLTPWQQYCAQVLALVEQLQNSVAVLGVVQDVQQLLLQADLLVFPAMVGHFARPIIEAGFCAVPVVASDLPPTRELLQDGKTGLLVAAGNVDELATKILQLLQNPQQAERLGSNARKFCQQRFGLAQQTQQFANILQSVLKR